MTDIYEEDIVRISRLIYEWRVEHHIPPNGYIPKDRKLAKRYHNHTEIPLDDFLKKHFRINN